MASAVRSSRIGLAGRSQKSPPAFELLESKLRPPHERTGTVSRAKLIGLLESARETPIVVVAAGPGWGKTTLLAQWASVSERPFAWLSIDESDNDPIVLLTYLAVALDRVSPLDRSVFDALGHPACRSRRRSSRVWARLLRRWTSRSSSSWTTCTCSRAGQCRDAVAALARHVPGGLAAGALRARRAGAAAGSASRPRA